MHFVDADNPSAPGSAATVMGWSLTTGTSWTVPAWTGGGVWEDSGDMTDELQEVVDRSGWSSGNAIIAVFDNSVGSTNSQRCQTYDDASVRGAKIEIVYEKLTKDNIVISESITVEKAAPFTVIKNEPIGLEESISILLDVLIEPSGSDNFAIIENIQAEVEFLVQTLAIDNLSVTEYFQVALERSVVEELIINEYLDIELDIPTDWIALANAGLAIEKFYLTVTGDADGTTDVEIPMANLSGRKRTGEQTYLQIVLKDFDNNASLVSARPNGTMIVEMNYSYGSESSKRQEIIRAELEEINLYEGPVNKSITLVGRETKTFINRSVTLENPIYKSTVNGRRTFRFARIDPYLNPGDTLVVGEDSLTVDYITYTIGTGGTGSKTMQVREI
jgi:hypothetical protein